MSLFLTNIFMLSCRVGLNFPQLRKKKKSESYRADPEQQQHFKQFASSRASPFTESRVGFEGMFICAADLGSNNSGYYDLQAVLTHQGRSSSSGHYVGWVKRKEGRTALSPQDMPVREMK